MADNSGYRSTNNLETPCPALPPISPSVHRAADDRALRRRRRRRLQRGRNFPMTTRAPCRPKSSGMADQLGVNTPQCRAFGLAACRDPSAIGRPVQARARLPVARRPRHPLHRRHRPGGATRRRAKRSSSTTCSAPRPRGQGQPHDPDRADQSPRPARLFLIRVEQPPTSSPRSARPTCACSSISIMCRSWAAICPRFEKYLPLVGHVQIAGVPTRASRMSARSIIRRCSTPSTAASGLDRLRIQATRQDRGWARLGKKIRRRAAEDERDDKYVVMMYHGVIPRGGLDGDPKLQGSARSGSLRWAVPEGLSRRIWSGSLDANCVRSTQRSPCAILPRRLLTGSRS